METDAHEDMHAGEIEASILLAAWPEYVRWQQVLPRPYWRDDWRWVVDHQGVSSERIDRLGALLKMGAESMRYRMNPPPGRPGYRRRKARSGLERRTVVDQLARPTQRVDAGAGGESGGR